MKLRLLWVMLIGMPLGIASAHGQALPAVRPGAVNTVIVSLVIGSRYESANFTIHPAEGVRILGATRGVLAAIETGAPRLPITFTIPADASVGEAVIGTISVEWPDGGPYETEIRGEVEAVHKLSLELSSDRETVQPGGSARIAYRLTNHGNATDTVRVEALVGASWEASPPADPQVIAAGRTVEGVFDVQAPRTAPLGEQRLVRVRGAGHGAEVKESVALMVMEQESGAFGLAQIPVSVFLGGSTLGTTANLSIVGRGSVGRDSEVGVAFRQVASRRGQVFGQPSMSGPRALVSLRHGGLYASAGEVSSPTQGLARGLSGAGTGVTVQQNGARWLGGMTLARPRSWMAGTQGGHLLQANLGRAIAGGTLSARLLDVEQDHASLSPARREQLAGVQYALDGGTRHRLSAEAGIVRQTLGRELQTGGVSVDAYYRYTDSRASISARVRRVPDQIEGSSLAGNEASLSGSAALLPMLRAHASGFWSARSVVGREFDDETRGASAGAQLHGFGSALGITGNLRESQSRFTLGEMDRRTSLALNLSTGFGPLSLRGTAEAGVVAGGELAPREVRRLQGQVGWNRPSKSAWFNMNYTDQQGLRSPMQLEAGTRLYFGEVNLDAVAGGSVEEGALQHEYLRAGAEVYIAPSASLVVGTEYQPGSIGSGPWTLSFGIRKTLSLPLPMRAPSRLSGAVFEDRNGNGRQDRGEPGVRGVTLAIGTKTVTTDGSGRFASRSPMPAGVPIRLVPGTLSEAYLALSTEMQVPENGRVTIPVVRAAALDLTFFDDTDADEAQGATEPLLSGVSVVLIGPQGRSYARVSDASGRATFATLPPGGYEISLQRNGKPLKQLQLDLAPGGNKRQAIPLRTESLQIRMWNGDDSPIQ